MKKIGLIIILFISFSFIVVPERNLIKAHINNHITQSSKVYVCGGKYATKFHSSSSCRGLNNCKAEIYYYKSQQEAKNAGYDYCLICWK